jgi:hypothetical protein
VHSEKGPTLTANGMSSAPKDIWGTPADAESALNVIGSTPRDIGSTPIVTGGTPDVVGDAPYRTAII